MKNVSLIGVLLVSFLKGTVVMADSMNLKVDEAAAFEKSIELSEVSSPEVFSKEYLENVNLENQKAHIDQAMDQRRHDKILEFYSRRR